MVIGSRLLLGASSEAGSCGVRHSWKPAPAGCVLGSRLFRAASSEVECLRGASFSEAGPCKVRSRRSVLAGCGPCRGVLSETFLRAGTSGGHDAIFRFWDFGLPDTQHVIPRTPGACESLDFGSATTPPPCLWIDGSEVAACTRQGDATWSVPAHSYPEQIGGSGRFRSPKYVFIRGVTYPPDEYNWVRTHLYSSGG